MLPNSGNCTRRLFTTTLGGDTLGRVFTTVSLTNPGMDDQPISWWVAVAVAVAMGLHLTFTQPPDRWQPPFSLQSFSYQSGVSGTQQEEQSELFYWQVWKNLHFGFMFSTAEFRFLHTSR